MLSIMESPFGSNFTRIHVWPGSVRRHAVAPAAVSTGNSSCHQEKSRCGISFWNIISCLAEKVMALLCGDNPLGV